jgi:uncharacterized protein
MLKAKIQNDLTEAMKASNKEVVEVLRSTITAITVKEKEKGTELTEEEVGKVITKQVKERNNSIQQFTTGNRPDLVAKEQAQLAIIIPYLPKPTGMSAEEIDVIVKEIISANGYTKADFGKVMGAFNKEYKGKADGKLVSEVVTANLQ